MAEFKGSVTGRALRGGTGTVSRIGDKKTGLRTLATSWRGAISVDVAYDADTGKARYTIEQRPHMGAGIRQHLAAGFLGELDRGGAERMAACGALDRIAGTMRERAGKTPSAVLAAISDILRAGGRDTAPEAVAALAARNGK
jgi:hypothetical protein